MNKFTILLISILTFSACSKEEVSPRNYPRVETTNVTDVTSSGMVFQGNIFFASVEIMDHGFIWTDTGFPTITNGNKISLGSRDGLGSFETSVAGSLQPGKTYSMRAYAKSENYVVYGKIIEFEI